MKKLILVLLIFSSTMLVSALDDQGNPNDPNVNERANACYEDGVMANKCDTAWEWEAGWYLIRFDFGLLSREEVPAQYRILLPPLPEDETPTGSSSTGRCIFLFLDPDGVEQYANFGSGNFLSSVVQLYRDSDCSTPYGKMVNPIVYAPSGAAEAEDLCQANVSASVVGHLANDVYACDIL